MLMFMKIIIAKTLNQGFKEHCVKKWDTYVKKNECFIFQKLFFMDDYQIQGGFR